MTRTGTSHFASFTAAVTYYKAYGLRPVDVQGKLLAGEIALGVPTSKPGEVVKVDQDGRYYILTPNNTTEGGRGNG